MELFNIQGVNFDVEITGKQATFTGDFAHNGKLELTEGEKPFYGVSYNSSLSKPANHGYVMQELFNRIVSRLKAN